jgi:hypothetical protein
LTTFFFFHLWISRLSASKTEGLRNLQTCILSMIRFRLKIFRIFSSIRWKISRLSKPMTGLILVLIWYSCSPFRGVLYNWKHKYLKKKKLFSLGCCTSVLCSRRQFSPLCRFLTCPAMDTILYGTQESDYFILCYA